jgi:hypothetical protein
MLIKFTIEWLFDCSSIGNFRFVALGKGIILIQGGYNYVDES